MQVSIEGGVSESEAQAIATVIAHHLDRSVEVTAADGSVTATAPTETTPYGEVVMTERERSLRDAIDEILTGGPDRGHEKIRELGKLFVRDRLDRFFDSIMFEEGTFAQYTAEQNLAADAIVTGCGTIDERQVFFVANDYTVKAGTFSTTSIEKQLRIQERAVEVGAPILYLVDSAGARITDQSGFFADRYRGGKTFYNQCHASGKVPQIGVLYGPCVAGAAYTPVFCDFLFMVEDVSSMAIASPRMVQMVTGQDIDMDELGGPEVHARESGSADLVVSDEDEAIEQVTEVLSYLPDRYDREQQRRAGGPPGANPRALDSVIPAEPNRAFDIHDLIDRLVDRESWFEIKPEFAKELLTGFGRLDGRPVGIIANQSAHRSGAIFPESADKAANFIWICDAFGIPLVYLVDTPGFMVGKQVEANGVLQRGRKFIYATSVATVPKFCVIVRKAYGAGIYAMCGPAFGADATLALPSAEIAVMGPEAAVNAVHANEIAAIDNPDERAEFIERKEAEYREEIDIRELASDMIVDELVPPGELREQLVARLETYGTKAIDPPERKHGTVLF